MPDGIEIVLHVLSGLTFWVNLFLQVLNATECLLQCLYKICNMPHDMIASAVQSPSACKVIAHLTLWLWPRAWSSWLGWHDAFVRMLLVCCTAADTCLTTVLLDSNLSLWWLVPWPGEVGVLCVLVTLPHHEESFWHSALLFDDSLRNMMAYY